MSDVTWQSFDPQGTHSARGTDGNLYTWRNEAWAPGAGPQEIWVNSSDDWGVTSSQKWDPDCWTEAYPHVSWAGGKRLTEYRHIIAQTAEHGPGYAESLRWAAAFSIRPDGGSHEISIWTDVANVSPTGDHVASPVINGVQYSLYERRGASWLVRAHRNSLVVTDVKACIEAVIAHKGAYAGPEDPVIDAVRFGWEIWGTGGVPVRFRMSHFSLSLA